eukprot:420626_1
MELLYQSNPTLIPMRGFDFEMYLNHHYAEKETTTLQRDVNDIVPALTPYSPPFSLHNMAHNVAIVNITPAPSNRPPLKLNSNESFAMEGSMVVCCGYDTKCKGQL